MAIRSLSAKPAPKQNTTESTAVVGFATAPAKRGRLSAAKRMFAIGCLGIAVIGSTGGMLVFSDDVPGLTGADRACIGETLGLAREVDALASRGVARARGLLDPAGIEAVVASGMEDALVAVLNSAEAPAQRAVPLAAGAESQPLLGSPGLEADASVTLGPHASAIYRLPGVRKLAVFCDFDGTFSVQDVGATLARQRAGERRPALWARYERGEITAWDYNMLLLDGLVVPEEELDTFLKTIELDAGAVALVRWCADGGIPFRILSDGFDRNLDGLQRIHGVAFEYDANRLRYEGDAWQIEAGFPNPECFCGTGTCKRGRIAAYRRAHPRAFCVHVGNGRVSDLCGAIEADLTFAKDTLAPALETRGIPYEPFANLTDVVSTLEPLWTQSGVA